MTLLAWQIFWFPQTKPAPAREEVVKMVECQALCESFPLAHLPADTHDIFSNLLKLSLGFRLANRQVCGSFVSSIGFRPAPKVERYGKRVYADSRPP